MEHVDEERDTDAYSVKPEAAAGQPPQLFRIVVERCAERVSWLGWCQANGGLSILDLILIPVGDSLTSSEELMNAGIGTITPVKHGAQTKLLLWCGIAASALYIAAMAIAAMSYPGYSSASYTVSELSAIGAPTRSLWISLCLPYTALMTLFGWGVVRSAGESRALRTVGKLLLVFGVLGAFWPPMHMRGEPFGLTDALHIAFAVVTVLLMSISIAFSAAAFGVRFKRYAIATLIALLFFGILTGLDSGGIPRNEPTPLVGVWERINIVAFYLWVTVLAAKLLKRG